ncbi:MAG: hypothetical protein DRP02_08060 [Candidatus Gerdarchaeota archaeon]|nr:MAG: hypothetical protein DRP02_08060 [Candidatus Gerdarchaeota archaeon]
MRRGRILSLGLLALFLLGALTPFVLTKATIPESEESDTIIFRQQIVDANGDKIEDKLMRTIENQDDYVVDVVLTFNHKITDYDLTKLARAGVTVSKEIWSMGHKVKVSTTINNIETLANYPDIELVSSAEIRYIMVAIDGDDYSDLAALEKYDAEIFWGVGCALVRYYSGIEDDIKLLGDYTAIQDTTDIRFTTQVLEPEETEVTINTLHTAQTINATGMWDLGFDGSGIKVGVIDSGINQNHVDFSGRVINVQSFIKVEYGYDEDDTTPDDVDDHGHGTHVSGTIAGDGTANSNYIGMAPQALIYMAKVGSTATLQAIIAALDWLVNTIKVKTINFSMGATDTPGETISEIAWKNAIRNKKVVCVTSAGNEGDNGYYTMGAPAALADIIAVGAADDTSSPVSFAYFTSRGPTADDQVKPDVLAPGYAIWAPAHDSNTGYRELYGTSMASPHVTGAVALLIEACQSSGIAYNPGLIKAALMKTAESINVDILTQGRGVINVGKAWTYILHAPTVDSYRLVGTSIPTVEPLFWWEDLLQGQVTEQYLTFVSPYKVNLSIEITGAAASFITSEVIRTHWSTVYKVTFSIPLDTTVGHYTGSIDFKYNDYVLETISIDFNVVASNGKRMLLNYGTTDWGIDHMYGQYRHFSADILDNKYVISEQKTSLDSGILDNYEAVWLPDPFSLDFPNAYQGDYNATTPTAWTESERTALTQFVSNGGTVFICFLGPNEEDIEGFGTIVTGTNVSTINEWTMQYGIEARHTYFTKPTPIIVHPNGSHPITYGVTGVDHYGTSLKISGDAVNVVKVAEGSNYATLAVYQHPNGGRVIVWTTNFALDSEGYKNKYNGILTQNDVLGRNLVRWALAKHRIQRTNITVEKKTVTLTYKYLSGPGADFSGKVSFPDGSEESLTFTDIGNDLWQTQFEAGKEGLYDILVECGPSGTDDFDYYQFNFAKSGGIGISPIVVVLLTSFGLAAWYLVQRFRRK